MKHRPFHLFLLLALFASLLGSTAATTPAHAGGDDLLPLTADMLNADGTLNLGPGFSGSLLDLNGWDVQVDNKLGPVFRPLAVSIPGYWSALGTPPLNNYVDTIVISGSDVYVGGAFTNAGGDANADYIAKFDTTTNTWSALGTTPLINYVRAIAISGSDVYAGGLFTNAGGDANADYIAKFDTTTNTWSALGTTPLNSDVYVIAISGSDVYAGGLFTNAGGDANADYIAKFNTTTSTWSALGTTPLNSTVYAVAISGSDVYAGGDFTDAGGDVNADKIAKFNTTTNTWSALGAGLNSIVRAIAISGSDVYAGGGFANAGGDANADYIAKFDTTTNTWSALGIGVSDWVYAIAISGSDVYAGGFFSNTGGDANADRIAKFDTTTNTWFALGTIPLNASVSTIAISGSDVYAGGFFTDAGGDANADKIAKFTPDAIPPTVLAHTLLATYTSGPSSFTVTFSEAVGDPAGDTGTDDVTNVNNYKVINKGANGTVETASCASPLSGDDSLVLPSAVTYINPTAIINLGGALPAGEYRLFVCGTTSIVDLAGNTLAGDGSTSGTDFTFDFTVSVIAPPVRETRASTIPSTGFAPNRVTTLSAQPAGQAYASLGDIWLEIPSLNVKSSIVGVPQNADDTWNVNWLGDEIGWLNGTAFPTWNGNSVLTAHVTNSDGLEGPFAALKELQYGEQVIVHLGGAKYVYVVQESRFTRPYATSYTFQSMQDHAYLTLVTCQFYIPFSDTYLFRRIVRAVLVSVESE